jgi:Ulp1 family protease
MKGIPFQENQSDCGVFTCKFVKYLAPDAKLAFKQKDMNYFRERMIYEIVKQELIYP